MGNGHVLRFMKNFTLNFSLVDEAYEIHVNVRQNAEDEETKLIKTSLKAGT